MPIDHTVGIWPQAAGGVAFSATQFQSTDNIITDLMEDMAAEQKARTTYVNILRLIDDQYINQSSNNQAKQFWSGYAGANNNIKTTLVLIYNTINAFIPAKFLTSAYVCSL